MVSGVRFQVSEKSWFQVSVFGPKGLSLAMKAMDWKQSQ